MLLYLDFSGTRDGYLVHEGGTRSASEPLSVRHRDKIARGVTHDWPLSDRRHKILLPVIPIAAEVRTCDRHDFRWRDKDGHFG